MMNACIRHSGMHPRDRQDRVYVGKGGRAAQKGRILLWLRTPGTPAARPARLLTPW